jgi:hypothetical protein
MRTTKIYLYATLIFFTCNVACFAQNKTQANQSSLLPNKSDYDTLFTTGEIVCSDNAQIKGAKALNKSQKAYDETMVGVFVKPENIQQDPSLPRIIQNPFKTSGICFVKYNSENGAIKKGDLITSSSEPGIGMKATASGIVLGIVLEDATGISGLIKIRIMIQYVKQ